MRALERIRRHPRAAIAAGAVLALAIGTPLTIGIEALVRARLDAKRFAAPTRIYARPLVIAPGETVSRALIEDHLERLSYRSARGRSVGIGEYRFGWWEWTIGRRAFRHADRLAPSGVAVVDLGFGGYVAGVRDADGHRLPSLVLEPELIHTSVDVSGKDRVPIRRRDVPDRLVDAVLTIEDQRFFEHAGLDARRIAGALLANLREGRVVQGASTLTQQLAKNLYLSSRRSPVRKLREAAMALVLEARYTKDEILEAYLNEVYLGQDGALAIHGVGRAAQFYFGKDVSRLDLAESAVLAGLIRGPNLYAPFRNPDAARARRNLVLSQMRERSIITDADLRVARRAPLGLRTQPEPVHARYFVDYVTDELLRGASCARRCGADARGLAVFTTLDMRLQRAAEEAVRDGLRRLERDASYLRRGDGPLQAALVALDPTTGQILAMVGGRDYGGSQFNRAANARRQPGSAFKPVVALAAVARGAEDRDGRPFTLATLLADEPLSLATPAGVWEPTNYDGRFRGPVTLREALERSLNVPFARLGVAVGPARIVETGRRLGIASPLHAVPSLALGSSEVTPLELTRAYGVLAAGGWRAETSSLLGVLDHAGETIARADAHGDQVFDPAEAYVITSALRGAAERGTGRGLRALGYRGPVAAKSGTTNDHRDAWFVAYTPSLTVGVWVGFDDGRTVGLPGSRAALPIVARFLTEALGSDGGEAFDVPSGLEVAEVDRRTGLLAGPGCRGEPEVFLWGTAPRESCSPWRTAERRWDRRARRWYERVAPYVEELRRLIDRWR